MKVAVVIPTRNEAATIGGVVAAADSGLGALGCEALIVNADGGSDDGTGAAFLATPTRTRKQLLTVEGEPGKGRNLLTAWRLCFEQGVDAAVMFDGDMTTVKPWWVKSLVLPIAARGVEFVSPRYRRSLYRGVSARSISRAFHYAWFGIDIQHPLSGNAAIARPLLGRLVSRDWTHAELGYGVETAIVSTVLGEHRPWATAQLDFCNDVVRFGHRLQIAQEVLTATVRAARTFPPCPGPCGSAETAPMTFTEGDAPETRWLEERIPRALDGLAIYLDDYARWAGDRIVEIEASIEARRLEASAWFHVFAGALFEARGLGRGRPAADYAAALVPLFSLRVLSVWREIEGQTADAADAASAAEVGVMRSAVSAAAGWTEPTAALSRRG